MTPTRLVIAAAIFVFVAVPARTAADDSDDAPKLDIAQLLGINEHLMISPKVVSGSNKGQTVGLDYQYERWIGKMTDAVGNGSNFVGRYEFFRPNRYCSGLYNHGFRQRIEDSASPLPDRSNGVHAWINTLTHDNRNSRSHKCCQHTNIGLLDEAHDDVRREGFYGLSDHAAAA